MSNYLPVDPYQNSVVLARKEGDNLTQTKAVLEFDRPHFIVKLYENLLKVDLKGSFKDEIEEALENKPVLKETLGSLLSIFVPLHVHLADIRWVRVDEKGNVKLDLLHRRDIVIPLGREDGEKLVTKLDQFIAGIRKRKEEIARMKRHENQGNKARGVRPSSYVTMPWYFPTEQVDIVDKFQRGKRKRKKKERAQ
jgi:hypothetical protein